VRSQYVHPKHPPDKEYRDDGSRDMNYPVTDCFRFPKIEHAAMVAAPNGWRNIDCTNHKSPCGRLQLVGYKKTRNREHESSRRGPKVPPFL
jgi:hypothetical protein